MRVLRISHSGVVDAWRERERAIRRRGIEVRLMTAQSWDEGGAAVPLHPRPGEAVTGVRTVGTHPALFLYDPRPLWRALREPWDLLDIHEEPFALSTAEVLLIRAMLGRRGPRPPYVVYSAQNLDKRLPPPFPWMQRAILRGASAVSVCNAQAGRLVEQRGFAGVADLIPLGVDTARLSGATRRDQSRPPRPAVVGYVGRLAPHKGVDVLLAACAQMPDVEVRIAGSGPSGAELRRRAAAPDLAGRVDFAGSLDGGDLASFYAGLDVLVVPSLTTTSWVEQFGRVAVEAMAAGVPVVASDSGALPDVVGGAGLLVPPGDSAALRAAVESVVTDQALADDLRTRGRTRAATYDWAAVGERYVQMYERVLHVRRSDGEAPQPPALEVLVVAYGEPEQLGRAIAPLDGLPITVVDNSSSTDVAAVCARHGAHYVDPGDNGGFAHGVNIGLSARRDPDADVLLLNPDAVLSPADLDELRRALASDAGLASVAPRQVDAHGQETTVAWPFPSPVRSWLEATGLARLGVGRPDFVIGSVLLVRAEALRQVGAFDDRFFLYAEETDWAYRAARLGWRHAVVPTAWALHVGAGTSTDPARRELHFHASQERYLRKHHGRLGWQLARTGQIVGAGVRSVALRGDRRAAAARRLSLYLRGPARLERTSVLGRPASPDAAVRPGHRS